MSGSSKRQRTPEAMEDLLTMMRDEQTENRAATETLTLNFEEGEKRAIARDQLLRDERTIREVDEQR